MGVVGILAHFVMPRQVLKVQHGFNVSRNISSNHLVCKNLVTTILLELALGRTKPEHLSITRCSLLLRYEKAEPAEGFMLEPAWKEDELGAASVAVLAGQPYQPDHLLQRLVGGVHEGLLANLAAAQLLCFPVFEISLWK